MTVSERAQARRRAREQARAERRQARQVGKVARGVQVQTDLKKAAPALSGGPIGIPGGTVTGTDERVPRLPCPKCGFLISISLADLLYQGSFTCAKCLTTLTMQRDQSQEALQHLQTLYVGLKDAGLDGSS